MKSPKKSPAKKRQSPKTPKLISKNFLCGGQFIGQGAAGCTFCPPLGSDDYSLIGKVTYKDTAMTEYEQSEKFRQLDKEEQFGIYLSEPKEINEEMVSDSESVEISKCEMLRVQGLEDMCQMMSKKAQGDLTHMMHISPKDDQLPLFRALFVDDSGIKNLFRGLSIYHSKGLVHGDIKPPNIVFSFNSPDTYLKFIDFGSSKYAYDETAFFLSQNALIYDIVFSGVLKNKGLIFDREQKEEINKLYIKKRTMNTEGAYVLDASAELHAYANTEGIRNDFYNLCRTYGIPIPTDKLSYQDNEAAIKYAASVANDVYQLAQVILYLACEKLGLAYDERANGLHFLTQNKYQRLPDDLIDEIGEVIYGMRHFLTKLPN